MYIGLNKDINFDPNQNYNTLENNYHRIKGLIKSIKFRDKLHLKSKPPSLRIDLRVPNY